jgi:alpha-galactosidase
MKRYFALVPLILFNLTAFSQTTRQILIETKNAAMVYTVGNNLRVNQSYLGKKLSAQDYQQMRGGREVYLTAGMENQFEPAIRMVNADGNPSLELTYVSHKQGSKDKATTTDILLKYPDYPVEVVLHFTSY